MPVTMALPKKPKLFLRHRPSLNHQKQHFYNVASVKYLHLILSGKIPLNKLRKYESQNIRTSKQQSFKYNEC